MSTRGMYEFVESSRESHCVYVHHDNYPTDAATKLIETLFGELHWGKKRYEADEFAAAFVAINKTQSGGVRLANKRNQYSDIEYFYRVTYGEQHNVEAYAVPGDWDGKLKSARLLFKGSIEDFALKSEEVEKQEA